MEKRINTKKALNKIYKLFLFLIAIGISVFIARLIVKAGSLTPSASPASTMNALSDVYNVLVGTYDSSGVSASSTGDAFQITQCAITKIQGGSCQ